MPLTEPPLRRRISRIDALAILVLPFAIFSWMAPFVGSQTIGRDYGVYSIENQLELQFSLRHGTFPLFVPGFAGGTSASALTLGQLYHPIAWLAAHAPGYWDGKALEWNTALRLLSLGVTQLVLLALLRRLGLRHAIAFAISFVTTYNLRMLDLFRYGASLESYTACLLLSASVVWYCLAPTPRKGPACIMASTYLLVVSGHPQMAYYGLVAALLVWSLAPWLVALFMSEPPPRRRQVLRFYLTSGGCLCAGVLLASAYTVPFLGDFLGENSSRVGQGYRWATALQDSWGGLLNSFWRPLSSDVHGAFGGSFLPLLGVLAPFGLRSSRRTPAVMWLLLILCVVTALYCLGAATPVHAFVWHWLPFQSAIRVPGRAAVLLPVLLMWMMAWALKDAHATATRVAPAAPLTVGTLVIIVLVPWALRANIPLPGPFHPAALQTMPAWPDTAVLWLGALSLVALLAIGMSDRWVGLGETVLAVALIAQTWVVMAFGTWVVAKQDTPSFAALRAAHAEAVTYPFAFGAGMYPASVVELMRHTFFPPYLSRSYPSSVHAESLEDAYRLLERRQPDTVVIEDDGAAFEAAPHSAGAAEVRLEYVSFNRLVFQVVSDEATILALAFPYSMQWSATVNGAAVRILRANANENAVRVPAGSSRVEFRYWSRAAMIGMVVSCATLAVVLLAFASTVRAPLARRLVVVMGVTLPVALYALWSTSVYGGSGLGTAYRWTQERREPRQNLAFGKRTSMSSVGATEAFHLFDSSRGVDGVRSAAAAFATALEPDAWWRVDLGSPQLISEVMLYEARAMPPLPLMVAISQDPGAPAVERSIVSPSIDGRWRITLDAPIVGRFVTVRTPARAALTLSEVEVYGP
jgi:Bacterial membrane protein YfhO